MVVHPRPALACSDHRVLNFLVSVAPGLGYLEYSPNSTRLHHAFISHELGCLASVSSSRRKCATRPGLVAERSELHEQHGQRKTEGGRNIRDARNKARRLRLNLCGERRIAHQDRSLIIN
jgi:hypothetical protein